MTTHASTRHRPSDSWPGLDTSPVRAPAPASPPRSPAGSSAPALGRLAVTSTIGTTGAPTSAGRPGPDAPTIVLHRPDEFFAPVGHGGLIGFGEAYLTGDWDSPDLGDFLTVFAGEIATTRAAPLQTAAGARTSPGRRGSTGTRTANTREQHRRPLRPVQRAVRAFLDPTLTYSSALFDAPT